MKRIRISLAAITFVLAIAGTTAQANKENKKIDPCSFDPEHKICTNEWPEACCMDEENGVIREFKLP